MKIGDLIYDVLVEEVKNKKLFNLLLQKWYGDNPTQEQIDRADFLINEFQKFGGNLAPNRAQTNSFLDRFDGDHGSELFNPENLRDITKYSLEQIESIVGEYGDADYEVGGDVRFTKDNKTSPEAIQASKDLWFGKDNLIIEDGDLRVYKIENQSTSMKYGYYQQWLTKLYGGNQWCVTGRGSSDSMTNLWGSYRNSRTFYFVIDESKKMNDEQTEGTVSSADDRKYYLSALQVSTDISEGYRVTSMKNDGDNPMNWNKIVSIYPNLANHKDELVAVKFDSKAELDVDTDIIGRITETPGNRLEFRRMDRRYKKAFIDRGASIKTMRSWEAMDDNLKRHYILLTTENNYKDKFQTWDIMNDLKKGSLFRELDNRLNALEIKNGIGSIFANLMTKDFDISRESLDNSVYVLLESKSSHKYGLYNTRSAKWYNMDGVVYEPVYSEIDTTIYLDDNDTRYVVETFSKTGEADNESFYSIFPITEKNTEGGAHFITFNRFQELSQKIHPENEDEDNDYVRISDINPETDTDIKESIKRRK
jgi:hypothetical protein